MHKSKLAGFIIDCQTQDLAAAAGFWGAALGMRARALPAEEATRYRALHDHQHGLSVEVQQVEHASRVHLDIESDDIEAEVRRLEALGATRVATVKDWVVMHSPTGHRFCVVRVLSADFADKAASWP